MSKIEPTDYRKKAEEAGQKWSDEVLDRAMSNQVEPAPSVVFEGGREFKGIKKRKRGRPFGSKKKVPTPQQIPVVDHPVQVRLSTAPQKRRIPPPPAQDRELKKAMRRVGIAVDSLGPSGTEVFKIATLQCVQAKLEEIGRLLQSITQPAPQMGVQWTTNISSAPVRQLTPQEADAQYLATHKPVDPTDPTKNCQWCGQTAVYWDKKKVPYCVRHKALGVESDQSDMISARLKQGFGGTEVIQVPKNVIDNAMAQRGGQEE